MCLKIKKETKKKISEALKGKSKCKSKLYVKRKSRAGIIYKTVICPYCSKEGCSTIMKRWHFDNCKLKIIEKC